MSNTWTKRSIAVGALAAGAVLVTGGAASAHTDALAGDPITTDNIGVATGNQVIAPVQAPIDVCGNSAVAGGAASSDCVGGSEAENDNATPADLVTTGNHGVGNGNQIYAPIQVPINACGNAVGALVGLADAGCHGGSNADQ